MENNDMDAVIGTLKDALGGVLDEARKVPPMPNTNTQHIVLHQAEPPKPEPKMAWICAAACIGVLFASLIMTILYVDLSRKYDRMQDYYNIILQHAPALKDIIKKESQ